MRKFIIFLTFLCLAGSALIAEELCTTPEMLKKDFKFIKNEAGNTLISETEYRSVLNADFDSVVDVLSDLEGAVDLFPNVIESRLVPTDNNEINRLIRASYKILGPGRSYSYIERINISVQTDTEFMVKGQMLNSLDGRLNNYFGSWHVFKLSDDPDGKSRTAVILYSYFDYNKPFFMQELILETFTKNEVAKMFSAVTAKAKAHARTKP